MDGLSFIPPLASGLRHLLAVLSDPQAENNVQELGITADAGSRKKVKSYVIKSSSLLT